MTSETDADSFEGWFAKIMWEEMPDDAKEELRESRNQSERDHK